MAADQGCLEAEIKIATILMLEGDFFTGMKVLKQVADRDNPTALSLLAYVYRDMGDVENQIACYVKMTKLGCGNVYYPLALIYEEKLEIEKAIDCYQKALENVRRSPLSTNEEERISAKIRKLEKLIALSNDPIVRKMVMQDGEVRKKAAIQLGAIYYKGIGVQADFSKSASWYRKATEKGSDYWTVFISVIIRLTTA